MKIKRLLKYFGFLCFSLLLVLPFGCATAGPGEEEVRDSRDLEESVSGGNNGVLPLDPAVMTGVLDNGLTWYVRENREPEERASLRLVIRAGSILEDEDQRGIAHLVEHMAFNGTENFEKSELIDYLESIGMDFGPEINAYTSFDETVYQLEIPTDDEEIVSQALLILEDWAHRLTMDPDEIDKERGVVREEWRSGRGASGRIRDQILQVLLHGSRYAERLPIGDMEVVMNTPTERVEDFYREWYRPELMAVIAVGDFDAEVMKEQIKLQFSDIPAGGFEGDGGRERSSFDVPVHQETLVKIVADPEIKTAQFELSLKVDPPSLRTEEDYRESLVRSIFWGIFNSRLDELSRSTDPPFIGAQGSVSPFVASRSFISYSGLVAPDGILEGLSQTLVEVRRIMVQGALPGELEREKAGHLSFIESAWKERDNRSSSSLAGELADYYAEDIFAPGMEMEYELFQRILPAISLEEVNAYALSILPEIGRTLTVTLPESGLPLAPPEEELVALISEADGWIPEALEEAELPGELMERPSSGVAILGREEDEETGVHSWVLENGAVVILKPTDFREDEVLFYALSAGGLGLLEDDEYHTGAYAPLFLSQSGLGDYSVDDLSKILAGKDVRLSPYIGENFEGFSGRVSPEDLEILFQLINMNIHNPGFTEGSFENLKTRLIPLIENRTADPNTVYSDRLNELVQSGAYRSKPLDEEILASMALEDMERLFRERFSAPGDFVYIFVGNISPEELEFQSTSYLAGPGRRGDEKVFDRGIRPPAGVVDETVVKGVEPKSRVTFYFHGEGSFSEAEQTALPILGSVIETSLREIIREDLSGTYSIRSSLASKIYPYEGWAATIAFGCDPERTEELSSQVLSVLETVKEKGIDGDNFDREIEQYRREYETGIEDNTYWLSYLVESMMKREILEAPLSPEMFEERLRSVDFQELAARIYGDDSIRLVLLPE